MTIQSRWTHFKLQLMNSNKFIEIIENHKIPCYKCGTPFQSYAHFGELGYTYDAYCKDCVRRLK